MSDAAAIVVGIFVVGIFVWMFTGRSSATEDASRPKDGEVLDPSDPRLIGFLIGMTGGDVVDAVVARYALERFEQIHGRKATARDVGTVVGLIAGLSRRDQ